MNNVVRLAIVDPNDVSRAALKHLLLGIDMVWLEADCSRYEFFADVVGQTQPDVALVSLDSDPAKGLALVARIKQDLPTCSVLCVSSSQEGSLILQAMRNGAKEFLAYPPRLEDFLAAIDRIQAHSGVKDSDGRVRSSRVITVCGAGGGVGCTSLATNLGCILAQGERNSVAVLDLDLTLGDADVWLDIVPEYTIQDVAENIGRLDYTLLKRSLTRHPCGAFLLPRPVQIDPNTAVAPDQLKRVVALLKATFTHLVIDVSKSFGPLDLAALEASDTILLVTQLDLPSLRNVVRLMQMFDHHDGIAPKIRIVVNRIGLEDSQISLDNALESLGREVYWELPDDFSAIVESRNNGVPLMTQAPKARLTRAIEGLARKIDESIGEESEAVPARPSVKGLFRFLTAGQR
ncbi:MAG: pilus assembly protein CpaE [Planctomycetaceae bacterium]